MFARWGAEVRGIFLFGGTRRLEYVICYDLTDDRRRDRLAKTLLDYGKRIQHSVFVAHLDDELLERMMARVRGEIGRAHV